MSIAEPDSLATIDDDTPLMSGRTIPHKYLSRSLFWYVLLCHVIPLCGAIVAIALLPSHQPGFVAVMTAVLFWVLSLGIGISVGYHRLFSHRAFTTPTLVRVLIAVCGAMAGQGPLIAWVALHRCHHHHSDEPGDPHSPWLHGTNLRGMVQGLWHAHFGWVLSYDMPDPLHYCPDLIRDRVISRASRLFLVWYILGLFLPAFIAGIAAQSREAALMGFLWGGCFRVAVSSQITWCINSICHYFGSNPHSTGDHSKNLAWLSVPSFGESWHNNHHAYPTSAAFGHSWRQIDFGFLFIRSLQVLGLATNVQLPKDRGAEE